MHINELKSGAVTAAHLLEFDSIHGRWRERFGVEDDAPSISATAGSASAPAPRQMGLPGGSRLEIVLECTGKFLKTDQLGAISRAALSG